MRNVAEVEAFIEKSHFARELPSPNIISTNLFSQMYKRGPSIGTGGATIRAYTVIDNDNCVIKRPNSPPLGDAVLTEVAVISRLKKKSFFFSENGDAALPREQGVPCELGAGKYTRDQDREILMFLRQSIMDAHLVGGAIMDVKPDLILRQESGDMAAIDYNGAILLPKWQSLEKVWQIRIGLDDAANKDVVKNIFTELELNDLLENMPYAVRRLDDSRAVNRSFVVDSHRKMLKAMSQNDKVPMLTGTIDSLLRKLIESYCEGIIVDWEKYVGICIKNADSFRANTSLITNIQGKIDLMRVELKNMNYQKVRNLDLDTFLS